MHTYTNHTKDMQLNREIECSVANLAALGCVRFCFVTFLTRKIWLFEQTHNNT